MPNTSVRAAAEGMPNYPRNPHRFALVRKLLMRWSSRAENAPVIQSSVQESFMNQHVDRRQLVAGTAFAAMASSSTAFARPVNPASSASEPDPALLALEAKFMAEWEKQLAMQPEHNAAERRYFDALPERPIEPDTTDEERALFAGMRVAEFEDKTHPYNVLSAERRREFKERKAAYDAERKDIEQRTGYAKMDRAYTRQIFRAGRAADKVLSILLDH